MRFAVLLLLAATCSAQVSFKVKLDYDNTSCVTGNVCTTEAFRAICTSPSTCPVYNTDPAQFIKLPTADSTNSTQSVSATKTHFTYIDQDKAQYALQYNTTYAYAVRNTYTANPSNPGSAMQIALTTPTGVHSATINWSSSACRSTSPCTIQVYRAQCSSPTSCPTYSPGSSAFTALAMGTGLQSTVGAQSTTWVYTDNTGLAGSTTYVWVATNSYTGFTTSSPASAGFSGTTLAGKKEASK